MMFRNEKVVANNVGVPIVATIPETFAVQASDGRWSVRKYQHSVYGGVEYQTIWVDELEAADLMPRTEAVGRLELFPRDSALIRKIIRAVAET